MTDRICVLSREPACARLLTLWLEDAGFSVCVAASPDNLPPADVCLYDADAFPPPSFAGRRIAYGRALSDTGSTLHRPLLCRSLLVAVRGGEGQRGLRPDPAARAALLGGRQIPLSEKEYALFSALWAAHGGAVAQEDLLAAGWGTCAGTMDPGILAVTLHSLRRKVEGDGRRRIVAVRGRGYALREGDV